eukprot:4887689-Amphidinium_carterae.1
MFALPPVMRRREDSPAQSTRSTLIRSTSPMFWKAAESIKRAGWGEARKPRPSVAEIAAQRGFNIHCFGDSDSMESSSSKLSS